MQKFAKAIAPAVLSVALVVGNALIAGSVDSTELAAAVTGLVSAVVVYLVPNKSAPSK